MNKTIYIADDDINISNILQKQLESEGYIVKSFFDGEELLKKFNENPADLIITDIMMPNMNGYELCREIRKNSFIPILMISAKDEEIDRILGLELGSDDYISKPFSLREISIKVRNILRRTESSVTKNDNKLICKDLEILLEDRVVMINKKEFKTTTKEYDLLVLLVENKNKAFSREQIISNVWGYDYYGETRQVDHLIKRLRKKMLEQDSECKIETIWGYGYKVSD